MIADIKEQVISASENYETRKENAEAEADELNNLRYQIRELQNQIDGLNGRSAARERRGSALDELHSRTVRVESLTSQAGKLILEHLVDRECREKFGVPAEKLSKQAVKDLSARYETQLFTFVSPFYTRHGKSGDLGKTEARRMETLERVWNDLTEKLETITLS